MQSSALALVLLLPFIGVFVYATWSEYRRFKREGRSEYGLTYDPETNTTHVGPIAEDEESFDPEDYVPEQTDADDAAQTDPNEQDTRT